MMSHRFFGIIHCWLLRYGKTNSVVKDGLRSALSLARARKPSLHGSHRSTRTSASVGADIRIGRRRCINRRVWHPCHTHAATPTPSARSHPTPSARNHIISRLRGYSKDAIPSYR